MLPSFRRALYGILLCAGFSMTQFNAEADHSLTGHGRGNRPVGASHTSRSPVIARNGVAATSHPLIVADTLASIARVVESDPTAPERALREEIAEITATTV